MANMSGLLGTAGGFKGTGVSAPDEDYRYMQTVSPEQIKAMNERGGTALDQQQQFLQAVQAQNGLQNQSSVYNQLQGIANGTGPNPAMAQLNQTTGQNVANQAAMMAGQRGSSANTGLIARQAANTGANLQQQAVGQGAVLQAQQGMNALNSMGSMANTQAQQQANATSGYNQMVQSEQNALLNQNTARAQAQAGVNQNRMGLIGGTAAQQAAVGGGGASGIGAAMAAGAEGGRVDEMPKMADGGMPQPQAMSQMQVQPSQPAPTAMSGPQSFAGQMFNGVQPIDMSDQYAQAANQITSSYNQGASQFKAPSKKSDKAKPEADAMADGGDVKEGFHQDTLTSDGSNKVAASGGDGGGAQGMMKSLMMMLASGGTVPALLSPGERVVSPDQAAKAAGGQINPMKDGKKVPGSPKVGGAKNSYANDTIKAELEPGSIVIPRSVTMSKDAEKRAIDFVRKHYAKSGKLPKKSK